MRLGLKHTDSCISKGVREFLVRAQDVGLGGERDDSHL